MGALVRKLPFPGLQQQLLPLMQLPLMKKRREMQMPSHIELAAECESRVCRGLLRESLGLLTETERCSGNEEQTVEELIIVVAVL